jgi:peptidoglycan/LPS O-acetylase OafA/YrhL
MQVNARLKESVGKNAKSHLGYIDAVRGYAVLFVILCHATYLFPGLPYPVHRITVLGWHGVQLFFLASAVTLMMSWQHEIVRTGSADIHAFFLRRFFRIAPAYYAASVLYFFLDPPTTAFSAWQAAGTFLFVNAWHPVLMGVTPSAWVVVPGSWSIGVEFSFYAIFPVVACCITSLKRAVGLFIAAITLGAVLNTLMWPYLAHSIGAEPADNFLYFWFPNQMSVFALGLCLFFVLKEDRVRRILPGIRPDFVAVLSIAAVAGVAFIDMPHWLTLHTIRPPAFLPVSVAFAIFIVAMSRAKAGFLLNPIISFLGRISFSAYLLHFSVLELVANSALLKDYLALTGWQAIVAFAVAMAAIVAAVAAGSWVSFQVIETPLINFSKTLIRRRRLALSSTAS